MSLFSSITNKSKLKSANKNVTNARKSEGNQADAYFKSAYDSYAELVGDNPFISETLYEWGFALFNQSKMKSEAEAEQLLIQASHKFSLSVLTNTESIKPAIDWGVTLMALANHRRAYADDPLFDEAIEKFQLAETNYPGSASYNIACIHAMRQEFDDCLAALEKSRNSNSLPAEEDILNDDDLANIKQTAWFAEFIQSLQAPEEPEPEESDDSETEAEEPAEEK